MLDADFWDAIINAKNSNVDSNFLLCFSIKPWVEEDEGR